MRKHHAHSQGSAKRLLEVCPIGRTVSESGFELWMRHENGQCWRERTTQPTVVRCLRDVTNREAASEQPRNAVTLTRSDDITYLSGLQAYCHIAIHRSEVKNATGCIVLMKGPIDVVCAGEFLDVADLYDFVQHYLKPVATEAAPSSYPLNDNV